MSTDQAVKKQRMSTDQGLMAMKGRKEPSNFSVKINSFSLLSMASVEEYISEEFEAGGYKWRMSIYPTGNKKGGGQNHVSVYLGLSDLSSLSGGWKVDAIVNFSAYNFLEDEYVTTQDTKVRRFHVVKTSWGISKFIDLDTFNDPSKGYLIDDSCVFGVDVFILNTTINIGDCLSMIRTPADIVSHSWKFDKFSSKNSHQYESGPFASGNYKWKIVFYPKGIIEDHGNSISLSLALDVSSLGSPFISRREIKLLVNYTLRVKDQIGGQHVQATECRVFSHSTPSWGCSQVVALAKLKDPNSGFLVEDSCIFEAEVKVIGLVTCLALSNRSGFPKMNCY